MAEDFAIGKALLISDDTLNRLELANIKIKKIESNSEKMAERFKTAMTTMNSGAGTLLEKLQSIQSLVGSIGSLNANGLNNISSSMGKTSTEAEKVANAITEATVALNRFSKTWQELGGRPQVAKSFEILTNREQLNVLKEARNEADAYSRALSEANKKNIAETKASANAIKEQSQAEKNRHEENMARLKQEASSVRINSSAYRDYVSAITMSEQTENSRLKKIERMSTVLEELKKKESEYTGEIEVLTRKINSLTRENERLAISRENSAKQLERQAQLDSRLRKQSYQSYVTSTEGALRTADNADSYARRAIAIKNLEAAIKRLRTTDANYQKDLQRLSDAHKRLSEEQKKVEANFRAIRQSQSNLMNTSGQLARKLALVFSVSQIEGYIMRLIRVRGEFELQNTALASILQNKDKADKLFGQITELAVKSPFTIKELTAYTKSLSAYSVEYEKLYDTTKMLADVSAGLGVDMQRLILAFGQVKAANFLRGTETRQFTEAGINMLGELAKYYSELEGRIVSVTEVQDRQFKRMISFQDVEEVFKRLTSAGGMFYNMQERQAETLAGMMSNLQDSIDIMLNSIGESNEGTIKNMISILKSIIENWEILANIIKTSAVAFTLYVASVTKAAIANKTFSASNIEATITAGGLNKVTSKLITSMKSLALFAKSNPFLLIASALTYATLSVVDHYKKVEKTREEYDILSRTLQKSKEGLNSLKTQLDQTNIAISNNKKLISELKEGSEEYKEAQENLNKAQTEQSGILSSLKTEYPEVYANIVRLKDGTIDITEAQKSYNAELEKTRTLNYLMQSNESFFEEGLYTDLGQLSEAYGVYQKESSKLEAALSAIILRLETLASANPKFGEGIQKQLEQIIKSSDSSYKKLSDLRNLIDTMPLVGGVSNLDRIGWLNEVDSALDDYYWSMQDYKKSVKEADDEVSKLIDNILLISKVPTEEAFKKLDEASKDSAKKFTEEFVKSIPTIKDKFIQEFVNKQLNIRLGFTIDFNNQTEKTLSSWQKRINQYIEDNNLDIKPILATDAIDSYFSKLRDDLKQSQKEAEKLRNATEQRGESGKSNKEQLVIEERRIKNITKLLKAYDELDTKKTKAKGENKELERLKEQISLIKKAGDEYKKLRQYYSDEEATKMVKESFADAFGNISLSLDMDFDTSGVINAIENLQTKAIKGGKKVVDETLSQLRTENKLNIKAEGLEEIQRQVEDIFSDYEFSLDLKTAGIDPNAFKNMLKAVGASDEELSLMGLDTTTFEQAQQKIRDIIKDLQEQGGKDQLDLAKKYQQQLTELEIKEARKRFDELLKLREKYQTNEEKIAKVQTDVDIWQKQLDDINKSKEARDALYAQLKDVPDFMQEGILSQIEDLNKVISDENEELLKLQIQNGEDTIRQLQSEALQLTQFWRQLFGDLGDLSVNTLRSLSSMVDEIVGSATEIKGNKGQTVGYSAKYTDKNGIQKQVTLTVEQYQRLLKQNNDIADEIQEKSPFIALWDAVTKGKNEGETQLDYITRLDGMLKDVSDAAFGVANNLADIFGANDEAKEFLENMQGVVSGAVDLGTGIAKIASGTPEGIISGSVQALSGIASAITSIFNIGDKKKERQIQRQLELVEDLQKAYEKLEKAIDDAYSIDTLKKANDQAIANLEEQNEALEKAIQAEKDKKKTDDDRIEDWQEQIEANNETIEQLVKDQISTVTAGILDDGLSAADAFVDAWLEAFQETGDGLSGLEENFNEMLLNMIKRQAAMSLVSPLIENMQKELGKYINKDDTPLTIDEADKFASYVKAQLPQVSEALENLFNGLKDVGLEFGETGDTMSGLQKGISSVTEETAQALEALLNSVRFYSADSNTVLHNIYNWLINPPAESPLIQELRIQSNYLSSISSLLNSVSKNVQASGKAIKVQIV